jgi:uncharacterized protein
VRTACRVISCVLLLVLPLSLISQVAAFEGDYIWEERFKASLVKAQLGQEAAQFAVAEMYLRGRGTTEDASNALRWFLSAAKQGHQKAAYKVGYLYLQVNGILPAIPREQAFRWIQKAARAGYAPAQYELAQLYFQGSIVERNTAQALKLMGQAKIAHYAHGPCWL